MALKLKITSDEHDSLPEALQKEYKQDGDSYVLDWVEVDGLRVENVTGLKKTLEDTKGKLQKAREAASKLDAYKTEDGEYIDPVAAIEAIEKAAKGGADIETRVSDAVKAREAALRKTHDTELKSLKDQTSRYRTQLESTMITDALTDALTEAGVPAKKVRLVMPLVKPLVRMRESENGTLLAEVIDEDGNPRVGDSAGSAMTIKQLVGEISQNEDFDVFFPGTGAAGSGASGDSGTSGKRGSGMSSPRSVSIKDTNNMSESLEDIASGKVKVVD